MGTKQSNSNAMSIEEYRDLTQRGSKKKGSPEHDEQVKVFEWAEIMSSKIPELKLLMAIPNGASYGGGGGRWNIAKRMKEEGVRSGVPDIFLPVVKERGMHSPDVESGLWIEMKVGKNKPSEQQMWWLRELELQGYRAMVCYSAEDAIAEIEDYLN